jgi:CheY-like chemotaxis protein
LTGIRQARTAAANQHAEGGTKLRARRRFSNTVDLALIDLVMPVMNGRELATRIRRSSQGAQFFS